MDSSNLFEKVVRKLMSILKTKDITLFEFFVMLDVNMSGRASKLEMKTGIQHLGLMMSPAEFNNFWHTLYKFNKELPHDGERSGRRSNSRQETNNNKNQPKVETIDFERFLHALIKVNAMKV
jgi:hypothetical protein